MCEGNLLQNILTLANETSSEEEYYSILQQVKNYVLSFKYLKQQTSLDRVRAYIASDFNYNETVSYLAEKGTITTAGAIKTSVWYVNSILKQKLGEDIISLIKHNPHLAEERLTMAQSDITDVLLYDTIEALPEFKYSRYSLEDCKYELLFLARYSTASFNFYLGKMNSQKLAYLNHLLTTPSTDDLQKAGLLRAWLATVKQGKQEEYDRLTTALNKLTEDIAQS